jgi:hypothetical protein
LTDLTLIKQTARRATFKRNGSGDGGIPEAPVDDKTYGRFNETWKQVIASTNDVVDGGGF